MLQRILRQCLPRTWWAAVVRASVAVVLGMAAGIVPAAETNVDREPLVLQPCHIEGLAEQVLCGVHEVFEDRESGAGRRIPIHVTVLPPLRRTSAPDPLFILAGGPGQGARGYAGAVARFFKEVRRARAIVLVDLRGTGDSGALDCYADQDELAALARGPHLYIGAARDCLAELDADVRHYTHAPALADLDEIRRRLGNSHINLWGGSWGTRTALLYALTYPDAVRSLILDGAVSLDASFPHGVAPAAQHALDQLYERCAADAACAEAFPHRAGDLDALLERLERAPATVSVEHPRTGKSKRVTFTRGVVAEIARRALYTPQDAARLLAVIRRALDGDFGPLAAQFVHSARMSSDDMALGATMAILCSEDVPAADVREIEKRARGTFLGTSYAGAWGERCDGWPAGAAIEFDRTAMSEAPALILSGVYDPVTPPRSGEMMARHFLNHQHVIVPGAAHNASFTGCVPDLIAEFLQHGGSHPLDTGCLAGAPLPPIVLDRAGGRP